MRVRAVNNGHAGKWVGYYNGRRQHGEIFELVPFEKAALKDRKKVTVTVTAEEQFSENWMERVEEPKKPGRPPKSSKPDDKAED